MTRKLYDFQEQAVCYHLAHHYSINASSMGTGKSLMALETARRAGGKIAVFAPPFLRMSWESEAKAVGVEFKFFPYSMLHKVDPSELKGFSFWIADECFVAGTKVDTPDGPRNIEDIRPGDKVLSAAGVDEVVAVSKSEATETIKINGIECTLSHPFMTDRGWVKAQNLEVGDGLLCQREAVRMVQGSLHARTKEQGEILRNVLCSEMANEPAAHPKENTHGRNPQENRRSNLGAETPNGCGVAPGEQLHVQPRHQQKSVEHPETHWPQAKNSGREWARPDEARENYSGDARCGLGDESRCGAGSPGTEAPLQDRYRKPSIENSHRGRRAKPRIPVCQVAGFDEAERARKNGVESVEIQEPGSRTVYNLQVKNHPSYSVNGWLVHNCHFLKSPTARRTHAFYAAIKAVPPEYFIGLTGTPIKNRLPDFWTLLAFCGVNPKRTSGLVLTGELRKFRAFSRYFCHTLEMRAGGRRIEKFGEVKADKIPELKALLKDKFIRFRVEDVLKDLPEMTRKEVTYNLAASVEVGSSFATYMSGGKTDITAKTTSALLKAPLTAEYCNMLREGGSGPLLVFTDHVASAQAIAAAVAGAVAITGQTPVLDRMRMVSAFQDGKIEVIVATIGSLSVGVTLTAARHVVFNDLSWVPADNLQAEKRIHRIGQKNACFSHFIDATPTDTHIRKTLYGKLETINKVIG